MSVLSHRISKKREDKPMTMSILSPHERALLAVFASRTREAKALRRAQALLWLDQGESLVTVATR
jgi:hypothetical protein